LKPESEAFGLLLHGTARAWRLKLDQRLRPMGLSQAKWRTLLHLSIAPGVLTQAEIAARLGIEEPTLVTLLHRLESDGWVTRTSSPRDRRCKIVHLGRRAQRVIAQINTTANELRHELLADIPATELQTCVRVLRRIRHRAEKGNGTSRARTAAAHVHLGKDGQNRNGHPVPGTRPTHRSARQQK